MLHLRQVFGKDQIKTEQEEGKLSDLLKWLTLPIRAYSNLIMCVPAD
jgi:uncharacterized protein YegL